MKKLSDDGRYGRIFTENFAFHISNGGSSGMTFYAEETLPALAEPYYADMGIMCRVDGLSFEGTVPMAVTGEKPRRPSTAAWQDAYSWLQRDIRCFGVGDDPQLKAMLRQADDLSAAQIEDLRKAIIEAGVAFYSEYGEAQKQYGNLINKYVVVAGALVKAGDYALEYILKYYFVGYGAIAAKFINPMKNLLATYVGEYIANGNLDGAPDFLETVLKGTEDALAAAITGMFWGDDLKGDLSIALDFGSTSKVISAPPVADKIQEVLGYVIAAYLLTSFARHYSMGKEGVKGDVYRSAIAAVAGLGLESLKAWFLNYVSEHFKNQFEKLGKYCGELYKRYCQKKIIEEAQKAGSEAYGNVVRNSFKQKLGELSTETYKAAKEARAKEFFGTWNSRNEGLDNLTGKLSEMGAAADKWIDGARESSGDLGNVLAGQSLNYALGGGSEDEAESRGTDLKEVVYNSLTEWLGVQLGNIYKAVSAVPDEVTMHMEDGKIILGIYGYYAEISIRDNARALCELAYDSLFSWLNALWQAFAPQDDNFRGEPDLRDRMPSGVDVIRRELDAQKERFETLGQKWQFAEYKRNTEHGTEQII